MKTVMSRDWWQFRDFELLSNWLQLHYDYGLIILHHFSISSYIHWIEVHLLSFTNEK